jgi:hypothetical protein
LAGFAPADPSGFIAYLAAWLPLIDIFLIWHMALLVVGVRAGSSLGRGKAIGGPTATVLVVLALLALVHFLVARLGSLTVIRPFF